MSNAPVAVTPPESWAEVRAHDQVMRYRRAGTGPAVLLLDREGEVPPLWPELDAALAARFRVIAPALPMEMEDLAARLAAFLEGLGVSRVRVVVAGRLCGPALELAPVAPEVERVVLVPSGPAEEAACEAAVAAIGAIPVLVVRRALTAAEALPLVLAFLDGAAPAQQVS